MRDHSIAAKYWGGAPDGPASVEDGLLSLSDSGVIDYDWYSVAGTIVKRKTAVMLMPDELRAMSTNAVNRPERLAGTGIVDLKVLCQRDDQPFVAIFAGARGDVRAFMRAVQNQRASVGEPPLPTIEALLTNGLVGVDEDTARSS